ncbi:MAG: methyltransferase domain-containing protein [Reyranella sp.]|uniref:class I SAM-dependent methyltransferase n=1 Tax=Reyranella sp. TaxID=1929291 RepID=UPI003D12E409
MASGSLWRRWFGDRSPAPAQSPPSAATSVVAAPVVEMCSARPPEAQEPPVAEVPPANAEPKVRDVATIDELDAALKEVDAAHAISDDAVRAALQSFRYVVDFANLPSDPFSKEYADYQLGLYELIAGRPYTIENERSSFLGADPSALPFPYYTQSWKTVSTHLMLTGLIIRTLELPSKSSVLEFGSGWGNTTLALAQMGYQVTAIDIEQRFLDIVEHRCRGLANPPRLLCRDFAAVAELEDKFDAIVFDASFHHCSDHRALLASLAGRLKPDGKVLFAAEPIDETLPMPWGLRLDGGSVWSTRCFGWLELGFTETYFREAASRAGFSIEKVHHPVDEFGTMFVARVR